MVATKFYSGHDDDAPYINWAECMNVSPDAMLDMELAFLNAMDWKVYVSNEEFFEKIDSLEQTLAQRQGIHRGWFTYVEMSSLLPSIQIAKDFIQTTLVFGLSYTVLVATMVASVFLVSRIPGTYLNASSQQSRTTQSTDLDSTSQTIANNTRDSMSMTPGNTIDGINAATTATNDSSIEHLLNRLNEVPDLESMENQTNQWDVLHTFSTWYSTITTAAHQENASKWSVISNNLNRQRLSLQRCENGLDDLSTSLFCNSTLDTSIYPLQPIEDRIKFDFNGIKLKFVWHLAY